MPPNILFFWNRERDQTPAPCSPTLVLVMAQSNDHALSYPAPFASIHSFAALTDSSELAASGFDAVKRSAEEEEEAPVVVDDDTTEQQFGEAQYGEADVIPCTSEEPAEARAQCALRKAVIR